MVPEVRRSAGALAGALFLTVCAPARADTASWKYKYVAVVVQNSGAHRPNAMSLIELFRRLAASKPPVVTVSVIGFAPEFQQLDEVRFARKVVRLLPDTVSAQDLREIVSELVFHGPSPVFDAVADALDAAGEKESAVLVVSNGIDNASDVGFDDLMRRAEKAAIPIIVFYYPTNPPLNGDSRLRKLAKSSGGRFIDVRLRDSWEQLMAALR